MKNLRWREDTLFFGNLPVAQFLYCQETKRYEVYDAMNRIIGFNDISGNPEKAKGVFRKMVKKLIKCELNYYPTIDKV